MKLDGTLTESLPADVGPGEYPVVVVIGVAPEEQKQALAREFPVIHVSEWSDDIPTRREDLYDDTGR